MSNVSFDSIMRSFPESLSRDPNMLALAQAIAPELVSLFNECDLIKIYTRIDQLPEHLLDQIATDFDVKWYLFDGSINAKRSQIRTLFASYRSLGTKQAIIDALSGLYDSIAISEWFEYGGRPGYFRLDLVTKAEFDFERVLELVEIVKRVSAKMEGLDMETDERMGYFVGIVSIPMITYTSVMDLSIELPHVLTSHGRMVSDESGNVLIVQEAL